MARRARPSRGRAAASQKWYSLALSDTWELTDSGLHDNVLAISLQGLANRQQASLYLEYPSDWAYGYTAAVREWVVTSRRRTTPPSPRWPTSSRPLPTCRAATSYGTPKATTSRGTQNNARSSLLVAFTAASQLGAVVATKEQETMLQVFGYKKLADFSTRFRGMSDVEVMRWAKAEYWVGASKSELMWMGGECGTQVRPAQADVGIARGLFFTDLSTLLTPPWAEENALADQLMMEASDAMAEAGGPPLIVLGWHSYCKDYEHTFITMASKHAARNHGLNTNPNLSFMSQLPCRRASSSRIGRRRSQRRSRRFPPSR